MKTGQDGVGAPGGMMINADRIRRPAWNGKTTISRVIAKRLSATYLRIDVIEQAMRGALASDGSVDIPPAGYVVANVLAASNLTTGQIVVADCVNPVAENRAAWRAIASHARVRFVEVEVICSDVLEHRQRADGRARQADDDDGMKDRE